MASNVSVGFKPDFRIYTASLLPEMDSPIVRMRGSSTERDAQRNIMALATLERDMRSPDVVGMTVFRNHKYDVPQDVFGHVHTLPNLAYEHGVVDLWLEVKCDTRNPLALQTLQQSRDGIKHGCSIGCMVNKWDFAGETDDPMTDTVVISSITPVEWSVVGIPANRRSWVENAIQGRFTRAIAEGDYDQAYQLAPTVKSLFSYDYERLTLSLDDAESLRFQLVQARPTPSHSITWQPNRSIFVLNCADGSTVDLDRQRVTQALETGRIPATSSSEHLARIVIDKRDRVAKRLEGVASLDEIEAMLDVMTFGDFGETPPVQLADDGDSAKAAQQARSKKYGIGIKDGGNVTKPSKWSSVEDAHWGDPVNYRYPMKDLEHANNAASRWGDASNRSQYNSKEQSIIGGRIKRRQRALGGGSDDKEKAVDDELTTVQTEEADETQGGDTDDLGSMAESTTPTDVSPPVPTTARVPVDELSQAERAHWHVVYNSIGKRLGYAEVSEEGTPVPLPESTLFERINTLLDALPQATAETLPDLTLASDGYAQMVHDHSVKHGATCKTMDKEVTPDDDDGLMPDSASVEDQKDAGRIKDHPTPTTASTSGVDTIQSQILEAERRLSTLTQEIEHLSGRGLGRPTSFSDRTLPQGVLNRPETLAVQTPEALKAQTTIGFRKTDGAKVRLWAEGLGVYQRPELATHQMACMSTTDIADYYDGRLCAVPIVFETD